MSVETRLGEMGFTLPAAPAPAANYVPYVRDGDLLYTAGQIPFDADGNLITGLLGDDMEVEDGQAAAERCALAILAQVKAAAGSLDRIAQIIKLNVFVASTPDFTKQPLVANGASDLLGELLGEAGRHARSAVGVAALPLGVAVEIDAVIRLTSA
ncbi:MAG: RidA family protein [Pacificimonas sp.]|jgi:enamine deaminase RidA (YjgF/YER057c/UK114 family)|nr:RidA family protein [Pacificimonas sp.]